MKAGRIMTNNIIINRKNDGTNGYIPRLKHNRVKKAWNGLRSGKILIRKSKWLADRVYSGLYLLLFDAISLYGY